MRAGPRNQRPTMSSATSEDAVAPAAKVDARDGVARGAEPTSTGAAARCVRINDVTTEW